MCLFAHSWFVWFVNDLKVPTDGVKGCSSPQELEKACEAGYFFIIIVDIFKKVSFCGQSDVRKYDLKALKV